MQVNTYLNFSGQCAEAFRYYADVFGGKIDSVITHGETESAQYVPDDWHAKVMHAQLTFGDNVLMGSDAPPDRFQQPQGFFVSVHVDDPAEAERIYKKLVQNGQEIMPIQETFWAKRFGMLVDQFDIPWMINCSKEGY